MENKVTKEITPYPEQKIVVQEKGHSTTTLVLTTISVSVIVALICIVTFLLYEMNDLKKTKTTAVVQQVQPQYVQPPVQVVPQSYYSYHRRQRPVIQDTDRNINMSSPISGNISYPVVPPRHKKEKVFQSPVVTQKISPYQQTYDTPPGVDLPDKPQDIP